MYWEHSRARVARPDETEGEAPPMSDILHTLLAERGYLVADGATGTNLFDAGLTTGAPPELWNVDHPERITDLHRRMIGAGADIILTNSFGGNRYRLAMHGDEDRVAELNAAAARIAREAADAATRPVIVAGSMGPTGDIFAPLGTLEAADARDGFAEQARALADGGADVLWVETMSSQEEMEAAAMGAAETGLPVVATMTFDTKGRTMMGIKPEDSIRMAHRLDSPLAAFGSNCGIGPSALVASIVSIVGNAEAGDVIVAKGNCGIPVMGDDMQIHYSGTPEVMAAYARMARDAGARIIGGCCGTTPAHLKAIADALRDYQPGPRPERADIEAALGELEAGADAVAARKSVAPRRGRRG